MEPNSKEKIIHSIKSFLDDQQEVVFAYVFGSFVYGDSFRDIDIGVYMDPPPDLMSFGKLRFRLAALISPHNIDLVQLNGIPDTKPVFAYEVCTKGKLILNKRSDLHETFINRVIDFYFDTTHLREQMNHSFVRRLATGNFGMRNYE
jgi:predicted nucleotidyltransferase